MGRSFVVGWNSPDQRRRQKTFFRMFYLLLLQLMLLLLLLLLQLLLLISSSAHLRRKKFFVCFRRKSFKSVTALKKRHLLETLPVRLSGSGLLQDAGQLQRLLDFEAARQGLVLGSEVKRSRGLRGDLHGQGVALISRGVSVRVRFWPPLQGRRFPEMVLGLFVGVPRRAPTGQRGRRSVVGLFLMKHQTVVEDFGRRILLLVVEKVVGSLGFADRGALVEVGDVGQQLLLPAL